MKKLITWALGLVAVGLLCATSAQASFVAEGDPFDIGSWAQGFRETGVGPFTQVETIFRSGPGGPFEAPGFNGFNRAGWTVGTFDANHVIATGPATTDMTWNVRFLGVKSSPLVFDFYAWNGDTLLESTRATWSGSKWTFTSDAAPVPEPSTVIAGALLLLPFGASALRILRKRS